MLEIGDNSEGLYLARAGHHDVPLFAISSAFLKTICPLIAQYGETMPEPTQVYQAMAQAYMSLLPLSNTSEAHVLKARVDQLRTLKHDFMVWELYSRGHHGENDMRISELPDLPFTWPARYTEYHTKREGPWEGLSFWFVLEVLALRRAVTWWLTTQSEGRARRYLPPHEVLARDLYWTYKPLLFARLRKANDAMSRFLENTLGDVASEDEMSVLKRHYIAYVFRRRTSQVHLRFPVMWSTRSKRIPVHLYTADGFLPLAWAEIMRAIDSGTYAHTCDVCGGVFVLRPPYKRAAYLCSPGCERKWKIERMGGLEAFRTYNREAQKKYRERMRARKERTQNAEEES